MRLGLHTSISGSLESAALKAVAVGANTFQIFSASPRMWRAAKPSKPAIELLKKARAQNDLKPLVIHDNYLINLASADEKIRAKSIAAFRGELERAVAIGAEYLVAHPGNYKGQAIEQGIYHVVDGIAEAAKDLDTTGLTLLLENTAGAGAQLGSRFEELQAMRDFAPQVFEEKGAQHPLKIGFCLDTCHLLAAGFDITTEAGLKATLQHADQTLGLANIPVIHANDSKGALESHLDRHQNIGHGQIGEAAFARILTHPQLRDKAFILETPMDDGWDQKDMDTLKRLSRAEKEAVSTHKK